VPATEFQELIALTLVFVVHVVGGLLLVWALLEDEVRAGWRRRFGGGGGGGGEDPPSGPRPTPPTPAAAPQLPLADAVASDVRLRGPGRLADAHPPRPRRPEHVPQPARPPR
jgi:hypothetical protein